MPPIPHKLSPATPLLALSAVSFDTETTGLDVRSARIIQIGAVRITSGKLLADDTFRTFVNPGEIIPEASTRIHGITDEDVAGHADFSAAYVEFERWAHGAILLGYSTGFDLAMLKVEAERGGVTWQPPHSIDVRHVVQMLAPPLPDQALDTVAAWLGLSTDARHDALADAQLTAEVFLALVPQLRDKGIRTLGQLDTAAKKLTSQHAEEARAGWIEVGSADDLARSSVAALARIDSFPYRHRVSDIMSSPPATVDGNMSVRDVLALLMERKISSVFVCAADGTGEGIVTERDILRAIDNAGPDGLDGTASQIANRPLISVGETEYAYRAIALMHARHLRHLAVVDADGRLTGAVSARDLLGQRAGDTLSLGDEIENAQGPEDLAPVWAKLSTIALGLAYEEVDPRDIAAIVSNELRALTRQACAIAEKEMAESGKGPAPTPYAMMVLGSGGRGESLLAMDQDNAIIYAQGEPGGPEDQWLKALGQRVSDILNAVGVEYCKGGIMAANDEWRMSAAAWRETVRGWIGRSRPQDIMNSDIYFDSMPVYGDVALARELRSESLEIAAGSKNFLQMLSHNAADVRVPLGWFGRFQLKDGRVDLKIGGIMPIFSAARVLALKNRIEARSTPERLEAARELLPQQAHVIDGLIDAHRLLLGAILQQQLRDIDRGLTLSNSVSPKELSASELDSLKWSVEQVRNVPTLLGNPIVI